jgi:hypothetical protein
LDLRGKNARVGVLCFGQGSLASRGWSEESGRVAGIKRVEFCGQLLRTLGGEDHRPSVIAAEAGLAGLDTKREGGVSAGLVGAGPTVHGWIAV